MAAMFGYPAWRQSREHPDLAISARHRQFSTSPDAGDVAIEVEIENLAAAPARDWHVTLESHGLEIHLGGKHLEDASERRTATDWRIDWQAGGEADSIGKGNTRTLTCRTGTMRWEQTTVARYWLSARGMKTRSGEIRIAWSEKPVSLSSTSGLAGELDRRSEASTGAL